MGLFNKKEKETKLAPPPKDSDIPRLPELPSMTSLPSLPSPRPTTQLPSYPSDSLGRQFSQNSIKNAVSGHNEEDLDFDEEEFSYDDFDENETIPEPRMKTFSRPLNTHESMEPVFIRIDKFENSLKIFDKTKKQITEIESMLKDIRKIQEEETKELEYWEKEILSIKEQIEKIDREVFSKI